MKIASWYEEKWNSLDDDLNPHNCYDGDCCINVNAKCTIVKARK